MGKPSENVGGLHVNWLVRSIFCPLRVSILIDTNKETEKRNFIKAIIIRIISLK